MMAVGPEAGDVLNVDGVRSSMDDGSLRQLLQAVAAADFEW